MKTFCRALSLLLSFGLCASSSAPAQGTQADKAAAGAAVRPGAVARDPNAIDVVGDPVVLIDPATGSGDSFLHLLNPSRAAVEVRLYAVTADGKLGEPSVKFSAGDAKDAKTPFAASLAPASVTPIRVAVNGITAEGEFSADLFNEGVKLGTISIRRAPIGLALETAPTTENPLQAVSGEPLRLVLKNTDSTSYSFRWSIRTGNDEVCAAATPVAIAQSSAVELECTPAIGWTFERLQDFFRAKVGRGVLNLYAPEAGADAPRRPIKSIPLAAVSASLFSPSVQTALSYFVLLFVLIAGGVTSLIVSQGLPNRLKRLTVKEQLEGLMIATANLTDNLDSKLQVLVRLERGRLFDLLQSRTTFSPEFASVITQCTEGAAKLEARVELLRQMDVIYGRLYSSLTSGVAPSLARAVAQELRSACVVLEKASLSDSEFHDAASAIQRASTFVSGLSEPGAEFGQKLATRVTDTRAEVTRNVINTPTWTALMNVVPGPWAQIQSFPAGSQTVAASEIVGLDFAVEKVSLMRDYVMLKEGSRDPKLVARLQAREPELTGLLQLNSHKALGSARFLIRQMSEDLSPSQLVLALQATPPEASIEMAPAVAYDRAALKFEVAFSNRGLNSAAAKEQCGCDWTFSDGVTNKGWDVAHYFRLGPQPKKQSGPVEFDVTAKFHDEIGRPVLDPTGASVELTRRIVVHRTLQGSLFGDRAWTEAVKLSVALLAAVFGLIAGASEQLGKLDLLPGVVAVFLIGFGADTIKNLLTSK